MSADMKTYVLLDAEELRYGGTVTTDAPMQKVQDAARTTAQVRSHWGTNEGTRFASLVANELLLAGFWAYPNQFTAIDDEGEVVKSY